MAFPPDRFGTDDYRSLFGGLFEQYFERSDERLAFHVVGVAAEGGMAQRDVYAVGPWFAKSTEAGFPSVRRSGVARNPFRHRVGAELRMSCALRHGAHVDQRRKGIVAHQRAERFGA